MRFFCIRLIIRYACLSLFIVTPCFSLLSANEVLRHVLVLYNSETGQSADLNIVFTNFQTILNYFGILPDYVDINQRPLPDDKTMSAYSGVITAFNSSEMDNSTEYLKWFNSQVDKGRKVVVIGNIGVPDSNEDVPGYEDLIKVCYENLGLRYERDTTINRNLINYVYKDKDGVEFERKYPRFPLSYIKFTPLSENVKTYLSIKRVGKEDSVSPVIITSPNGGYVHLDYIFWQDKLNYRKQWYLNPFKFIEESLNLNHVPKPDPTTLNGTRIAFSHIDGDSFSVISQVDNKYVCAEIIMERILKRFDFPVTVSVITGEISPNALGNNELVKIAKSIFKLPNVEPASHSYAHPFYWATDYKNKTDYNYRHLKIPGYSYDSAMEIDSSVKYINEHLVPTGKLCETFLWTGNCEPTEGDITRCDNMNLLNLNGNDTIFDEARDSYLFVAPLYRKVGKKIQYYNGQSNENVLTNNWTEPFYGYRGIINTMKKTEYPRRIKPIDIYYHFYCGQHLASLKSLEDVYAWVLKQKTAKVFTSDYIKMVRDYLNVKIYGQGNDKFSIMDYGNCLTMRFDNINKIPNLTQCENVLGYVNEPQGLYVSLAPGKKKAIITLSDKIKNGVSAKTLPYIKKATGWITNFESNSDKVKFNYKGYGMGSVEIVDLKPKKVYKVNGSGVKSKFFNVESDNNGVILIDGIVNGELILQVTDY